MSDSGEQDNKENVAMQPYGNLDTSKLYSDEDAVFPDWVTITLKHLHGAVESRSGLGLRERVMLNLTSHMVIRINPGLSRCMRLALRVGITREEILEVILHVTHYAGWPRGGDALLVANEVFSPDSFIGENSIDKKLGIADSERQKRGEAILKQMGWYDDLASTEKIRTIKKVFPDFWKMTEGHLFGDIWARPGLSLRDRLIITIGTIIALGCTGMLKPYLRQAVRIGLSREEILEIIMQVGHYAGWPVAEQAIMQFDDALSE